MFFNSSTVLLLKSPNGRPKEERELEFVFFCQVKLHQPSIGCSCSCEVGTALYKFRPHWCSKMTRTDCNIPNWLVVSKKCFKDCSTCLIFHAKIGMTLKLYFLGKFQVPPSQVSKFSVWTARSHRSARLRGHSTLDRWGTALPAQETPWVLTGSVCSPCQKAPYLRLEEKRHIMFFLVQCQWYLVSVVYLNFSWYMLVKWSLLPDLHGFAFHAGFMPVHFWSSCLKRSSHSLGKICQLLATHQQPWNPWRFAGNRNRGQALQLGMCYKKSKMTGAKRVNNYI